MKSNEAGKLSLEASVVKQAIKAVLASGADLRHDFKVLRLVVPFALKHFLKSCCICCLRLVHVQICAIFFPFVRHFEDV